MSKRIRDQAAGAKPAMTDAKASRTFPTARQPTWRAEPSSFSREEMRQIVIEMIG